MSSEEALLSQLLTGKLEKLHIEQHLKAQFSDAVIHGVASLLASKYHQQCLNLPSYIAYLQQQTVVHQLQLRAIQEITKTLNRSGINFIVLKGWALAYSHYSKPYLRPKSDIDILINERDVSQTKAIFEKLGYINPRGWTPEYISFQFSRTKNLLHAVRNNVDIHLCLTNDQRIQSYFPHSLMFQSATYCRQLGCDIVAPPQRYCMPASIYFITAAMAIL